MISSLRNQPHNVTPQRGDQIYTYAWRHMPSGKTGVQQGGFISRAHFLELLNRWNAADPERWKYWEYI
jgi:hypothetical protein